jgi:hypothetical protein
MHQGTALGDHKEKTVARVYDLRNPSEDERGTDTVAATEERRWTALRRR